MPAGHYIRTKEIREKNSLGTKGKKRSDEFKHQQSLRYSGKGNPFYGKTHSKEVKALYSLTRRDENAWNYKGNLAGKAALHSWVKIRLPKPRKCSKCNSNKFIELSNNGNYLRDLSDWEWLCRSCHTRKDKKILNITKHMA